jgi:hypothetical protein
MVISSLFYFEMNIIKLFKQYLYPVFYQLIDLLLIQLKWMDIMQSPRGWVSNYKNGTDIQQPTADILAEAQQTASILIQTQQVKRKFSRVV